ncbi:hypothetical protein Hanom_Chr16g01462631 [Helianthus anomalus]
MSTLFFYYAVNLGDISVISRRYLGYRPVTKISVSDIGHNIGGQRRNIGRYLAKPYRLSRRYLVLGQFCIKKFWISAKNSCPQDARARTSSTKFPAQKPFFCTPPCARG